MPDWVVMTVGLNPLPCLIEAYRLCEIVRGKGRPLPSFLAFTGPRSYEAEQTRAKLTAKLTQQLGSPVSLDWQRAELKQPFSPRQITTEASTELRKRLPPSAYVHFPYTGGTKAMSVHVLRALQIVKETDKKDWLILPSYLSPESHALLSETTEDESGVEDERRSWHMSAEDLADLHYFKVESASTMTGEVEQLAARMLPLLMKGEYHEYYLWLGREWKRAFGGSDDKDVWIDRLPNWPTATIPFYPGKAAGWKQFADELAACSVFAKAFDPAPGGGWLIHVSDQLKEAIIPLYHFLDNQALEIYAYTALKELMPGLDALHSVKCIEKGSGKRCELDVVGVLGYELIGISCTLSSNYGQCKRKGFEIIHRVRQIGGDRARACLLCLLPPGKASALEHELKDDLDSASGESFTVFGRNVLEDAGGKKRNISVALRDYLVNKLRWYS